MSALFTPSVTDALLHLEAGAEALSEYRDISLGVRDELDARWASKARANCCATALSSASPIKPTSLSCPYGLQSTFAGANK